MTTHFLDQSAALDAHLATMADLPPVAWEGLEFAPVSGTLYLKPKNEPSLTVAKTERDKTEGSYRIDIHAPAGEGKGEAILMSDKIANHFKHGTELTYNGLGVEVENVRREEGARPVANVNASLNTAWFVLSVIVDYYSFTVRR